jgi:hypothetical protein
MNTQDQAKFLTWFLIYTLIFGLFDWAIVNLIADRQQNHTALYVLPRTWIFRSFLILVFRAYLGYWNSYIGRIDVGQQRTFYIALPILALVLPLLPLKNHVQITIAEDLIVGMLGMLSLGAFILLLRRIGLAVFVTNINYANDRLAGVMVSKGSRARRINMLPIDIGYGSLVAVMEWGYCSFF